MFSVKRGIKFETNKGFLENLQIFRNYYLSFKNLWGKEDIKSYSRKYFELSENKNKYFRIQ